MSERPTIAITCDLDFGVDRRGGRCENFQSPTAYAWCIRQAGGLPWLLPHVGSFTDAHLRTLDGVVVTGGAFDVPSDFYGQTPDAKLGQVSRARSEFERAVVQFCLANDIPLLCICGGMQLLNVVLGGTLFQDMSLRGSSLCHEQKEPKHRPSHRVKVSADTHLAEAAQTTLLDVNSTHHQAIDSLGQNLRVAAVAFDGVIEAIEHTAHPFAVGVQWHPEAMAPWESLSTPPSKLPISAAPLANALYERFILIAEREKSRRETL